MLKLPAYHRESLKVYEAKEYYEERSDSHLRDELRTMWFKKNTLKPQQIGHQESHILYGIIERELEKRKYSIKLIQYLSIRKRKEG